LQRLQHAGGCAALDAADELTEAIDRLTAAEPGPDFAR